MSLSPAFAVVSSPVATTGTALRGAAPKSIETGVQGHGTGAGRMKEWSDERWAPTINGDKTPLLMALLLGNWGYHPHKWSYNPTYNL